MDKKQRKNRRKSSLVGIKELANMVGVTRNTIYRWYRWYEGDEFSKPKHCPGLPPYTIKNNRKQWKKSDAKQIIRFKEWMHKSPKNGGGFGSIYEYSYKYSISDGDKYLDRRNKTKDITPKNVESIAKDITMQEGLYLIRKAKRLADKKNKNLVIDEVRAVEIIRNANNRKC